MDSLLHLPLLRTFLIPRFRNILLIGVFVPSYIGFTLYSLILRLIHPDPNLRDLQSYLIAAQDLIHNMSPYTQLIFSNPDPTLAAGYEYPPLLAWLLIPVAYLNWTYVEMGAIILAYLSLVGCVYLSVKSTRLGTWQNYMLGALVVIFFDPLLTNLFDKNVTIELMLLTAFWLYTFTRANGVMGGIALGLAIAIKMFEAPILLLLMALKEKKAAIGASLTIVILSLLAAPQYLWSTYTRIVQPDSGGSGYVENQAPAWLIARLFHPESIRGQNGSAPLDARIIVILVALFAIGLTIFLIRKHPLYSPRRPLVGAAMIALLPMTWPYCLPQHMSLILPSIIIVLIMGIDKKKPLWILGMILGFLLLSPGHSWFVHVVGDGFMPDWFLRTAGMLGPLGAVVVFGTALLALAQYDALELLQVITDKE